MRITLTADEGSWAGLARDYLERGTNGTVTIVSSQPEVSVTATGSPSSTSSDDRWRLTDVAGQDLWESEWVADAVARRTTVEVQLRSGDDVLAAGRTDVRRTVRATVETALAAAGPLIEMAVAAVVPIRVGGGAPPQVIRSRRVAHRRATTAFGGRVARAAVTYRQWGIARLPRCSVDDLVAGTAAVSIPALEWQSPAPDHFWADPCVVAHDGQEWIFVEELDRKSGRGHIRALRWDGVAARPGPVVFATSHHLSYPQVKQVAGRWLATVETCAAANPILTFDRLGEPWRVAADLPALPPHMADPVVEFDAAGRPERLISTDAATSPDAHYVEHRLGPEGWHRLAAATYVDVTSARGGGSRHDGVRAVQDCAGLYGRALGLVPERDWHGTVYGDPLATVSGDEVTGDWQPAGVHTLTWTVDQEHVWIDGWRRRGSPVGGYRRLIERRHLKECDGT